MTGDPTAEPSPAGTPPPTLVEEGRGAYVVSQLYYYVAAVVGVGFIIGGTIGFLFGVRTAVLPDEFESARDGLRTMLVGLSFAIPGIVTLWAHVRQARKREGQVRRGAFWGSALYFHLIALIALFVVLGGIVGLLIVVSEAVIPACDMGHGYAPATGSLTYEADICERDWGDTGRGVLNASIFILAGAPLLWWHLRQGRRMTTPSRSASD